MEDTKHRFGKNNEFLIRDPSFRDRMTIEGRVQAATLPYGIMFEFMPESMKNWVLGCAILETCLEAAPDPWYQDIGGQRKIVAEGNLPEQEVLTVIEEARSILDRFWTTAYSRK